MKEFLDMRTLMFVSGIISMLICICMIYVYLRRKTYDGFRQWVLAYVSITTGMILLSLRNILPDFITIIMANACLLVFIMLITHGLTAFAGLRPRTWLYAAAIALYTAVVTVFTYIRPDLNMRIVLFSCITVPFGIGAVVVIYRDIPRILPRRNWFLIANFAANALWFFLRFFWTIYHPVSTGDLITAGPIHDVTMMISMGISILSMAGLIILTAQRVEYEVIKAHDEIKTLKGFLPICANCKKIRDDDGYWSQVEEYISRHADVSFSHGICPECMAKLYPELSQKMK